MKKEAKIRWPDINLSVEIGGGGNLAKSLGMSQWAQNVTLAWTGGQIQALMTSFGWASPESGEQDRAVWALGDIFERAVEDCAWVSGYSLGHLFDIKKCFEQADPMWHVVLCGTNVEPKAQPNIVHLRSTINLELPMEIALSTGSTAINSALLRAMREERSARFVSTLIHLFERLGVSPQIKKEQGLVGQAREASVLSGWDWPKRGAALVVDFEDGSAVCARVTPAGIRVLGATALGHAFGPRTAFTLLSSMRPLRSVLSARMPSRGYRSCALSQNDPEYFPMVMWSARSSWRDELAPSPEAVEGALRQIGLGAKGLSQISWIQKTSTTQTGAFESPAAGVWLAGLNASLQAEAIARSLKKSAPIKSVPRRL